MRQYDVMPFDDKTPNAQFAHPQSDSATLKLEQLDHLTEPIGIDYSVYKAGTTRS